MGVVEEEAVVAEVAAGRVLAVIGERRTEACAHCGLCFRRPDGSYQVEALTELPVQPGDRVVIALEQRGAVPLTVLVFLVPAAALVLGLVVGGHLARQESRLWRDLVQAVLGLAAAGVAFFGLSLYDRSLRARQRRRPPRIVRVVREPAAKCAAE
jgi:positive regulator of sigma E activity